MMSSSSLVNSGGLLTESFGGLGCLEQFKGQNFGSSFEVTSSLGFDEVSTEMSSSDGDMEVMENILLESIEYLSDDTFDDNPLPSNVFESPSVQFARFSISSSTSR